MKRLMIYLLLVSNISCLLAQDNDSLLIERKRISQNTLIKGDSLYEILHNFIILEDNFLDTNDLKIINYKLTNIDTLKTGIYGFGVFGFHENRYMYFNDGAIKLINNYDIEFVFNQSIKFLQNNAYSDSLVLVYLNEIINLLEHRLNYDEGITIMEIH